MIINIEKLQKTLEKNVEPFLKVDVVALTLARELSLAQINSGEVTHVETDRDYRQELSQFNLSRPGAALDYEFSHSDKLSMQVTFLKDQAGKIKVSVTLSEKAQA